VSAPVPTASFLFGTAAGAVARACGSSATGPSGNRPLHRRSPSRLGYLCELAWLAPRMLRAVQYLGYVLVGGTRA
jgi:hypothetical protein